MPSIPLGSGCRNCPESRTIKVYQYTLATQAIPVAGSPAFFTSFNTSLVEQADTDEDGFFQVTLAPGRYSLAVAIDRKLYANSQDEKGGLNAFTVKGGIQKLNSRSSKSRF